MGIDTSMYGQIKQPEIQNPLNALAQVAAVQQAQNTNRLADLTFQQHQRELDGDNALAGLLAKGLKPEEVATGLAAQGHGKISLAYTKQQQEILKQQGEIAKAKAETGEKEQGTATKRGEVIGQTLGALMNVPNVNAQHVTTAMQHLVDIGVLPVEMGQKVIAGIPQDASQMTAFLKTGRDRVMSAKDQRSYTEADANNVATNKQSDINSQRTAASSKYSTDSTAATSRANTRDNIAKDYAVNGMTPGGKPSDDVESMAQGIASGKLSPLSGFALAKPRGQAIMARVMEISPNYDAGDYAAKNAALKGFSTGKEGTALRSFNVAVDHLDTLGAMADALHNSDSRLLNKASNTWKQATGNPAPTNFEAVKEIVGKEVVKAIVAGGGGVSEREEVSNLMNKVNSPAQLKGVINHFKELMDAQRSGLMDQYQRTTGRTDGDKVFAPSTHTPAAAAPAGVPADIAALVKKHGGK